MQDENTLLEDKANKYKLKADKWNENRNQIQEDLWASERAELELQFRELNDQHSELEADCRRLRGHKKQLESDKLQQKQQLAAEVTHTNTTQVKLGLVG